ncbi:MULTISPECIES: hypothetical protein [Pseudomonas]|jgi:hypothetical protein|uniref:Uncharacterized protein n=1 Tax=Pseudomonas germanica TaxID=2815720 RepID=A0ABX8YSF1_9PSED|nr:MULTISPECIES: hypothetical protein [Pseudomonas]QYY82881.1 hypothetical protein J0G10_05370 [Pseudomonas germanica]UVL35635.1 hypothetical protein LOY43_04220 [Pseudomonas sp. B21-041]
MSTNYAAPTLSQIAASSSDILTLQLSTLPDVLTALVPDSSDFPANWSVYPILGDDPETPLWAGEEVDTGTWDDAEDEMEKLMGIELQIPKEALRPYLNTDVELRYKFVDESSMEPFSQVLMLRIEA